MPFPSLDLQQMSPWTRRLFETAYQKNQLPSFVLSVGAHLDSVFRAATTSFLSLKGIFSQANSVASRKEWEKCVQAYTVSVHAFGVSFKVFVPCSFPQQLQDQAAILLNNNNEQQVIEEPLPQPDIPQPIPVAQVPEQALVNNEQQVAPQSPVIPQPVLAQPLPQQESQVTPSQLNIPQPIPIAQVPEQALVNNEQQAELLQSISSTLSEQPSQPGLALSLSQPVLEGLPSQPGLVVEAAPSTTSTEEPILQTDYTRVLIVEEEEKKEQSDDEELLVLSPFEKLQILKIQEQRDRQAKGAHLEEEILQVGPEQTRQRLQAALQNAQKAIAEEGVKGFAYRTGLDDHLLPGTQWNITRTLIKGKYDIGICRYVKDEYVLGVESLAVPFTFKDPQGRLLESCLLGIFEPHSGPRAALYVQKQLKNTLIYNLIEYNLEELTDEGICCALTKTFVDLNKNFKAKYSNQKINPLLERTIADDGTTALIALILDQKIFIANAGNSRAALSKDKEVLSLTDIQDPLKKDYRNGIEDRGGFVDDATGLVNGQISTPRGIGFANLKGVISSRPEITMQHFCELSLNHHLILYSSAISQAASAQELVQGAVQGLQANENLCPQHLAHDIVYSASKSLKEDEPLFCFVVKINETTDVVKINTDTDTDSENSWTMA